MCRNLLLSRAMVISLGATAINRSQIRSVLRVGLEKMQF